MKKHVEEVNYPPHYTGGLAKCECGKSIECIQITEHMNFCLGNSIKYIWRADLKEDPIKDLKKAKWYIDRELERRQKKRRAK